MVVYLFILFALLALASGLGMILNKNTVNSALFLVLNMMSVAALYLLLQAQFMAVIQILVYAGAIMVLFLFVIMLLNIEEEPSLFNKWRAKYFLAFIIGTAVFAQILYSLSNWTDVTPQISETMINAGTVEAIGDALFTSYLLPFEITAILLTAAVVGALVIAQHKVKKEI